MKVISTVLVAVGVGLVGGGLAFAEGARRPGAEGRRPNRENRERNKERENKAREEREKQVGEAKKKREEAREEREKNLGENKEKADRDKTADPGVNRRQRHQASRIARGIKFGSLTKDEAKMLIGKEKELADLEKSLKGDGVLTKDERKQLHTQLNDLSKVIFQEKHDGEVRGADTPENIKIRNRLGTGALERGQGREFAQKAGRLAKLLNRLNGKMTDGERAGGEKEAQGLIDELYEVMEQDGKDGNTAK
ncbi:MAG: hypothetical protein V1809_14850 [Planctomycetota bacterium]